MRDQVLQGQSSRIFTEVKSQINVFTQTETHIKTSISQDFSLFYTRQTRSETYIAALQPSCIAFFSSQYPGT